MNAPFDWMKLLCSRDEHRRNVAAPFLAEWRGETWTIATDGRCLLAVRGAHFPPRDDAPKNINATILDQNVGQPFVEVNLAELRRWSGPVELTTAEACARCREHDPVGFYDCENCRGSGECHHCECKAEHECGACKGEGLLKCTPCHERLARIGPVYVSRAQLSRLLARVDGDLARVTLPEAPAKGPRCGAVTVEGADWFALVMTARLPERDSAEEERARERVKKAPAFELWPVASAPAAGEG